jgi:hypothetical protein
MRPEIRPISQTLEKGEHIMLKLTLRYSRYALASIASVVFGVPTN